MFIVALSVANAPVALAQKDFVPARSAHPTKIEFVVEPVRLPDGSRLTEGRTDRLDLREILHIEQGTVRTVRATIPYSNMDNRFNPPTKYRVVSGSDRISLAGGNSNLGEAVIEALREGKAELAWEITDPRPLPGIVRSGRIDVRVGRRTTAVATGGGQQPSTGWADPDPSYPNNPTVEGRAADVVRGLYRAVLLREPDAGGSGYVEQIRRSGWLGLSEVARSIANSEESQRGVYTLAGVNEPRRAQALYLELLGIEDRTVPRLELDRAYDLLRERRIDELVQSLVRRPEFRQRFGIAGF